MSLSDQFQRFGLDADLARSLFSGQKVAPNRIQFVTFRNASAMISWLKIEYVGEPRR